MILQGRRVALPLVPVVHGRFEAHARVTPDAVAVFCAGERVSYAELDARANRFAHFLAARGHGRGAKVGVCLDYSIDMVVVILGTLKAGAAYVPLDPSYPAARLRLLLGQVPDLALIVASPATAGLVGSATVEVIALERLPRELEGLPMADPDVEVTGDDLCYAVFTSGSTGVPKLTGVRHQGWFNLLNWLVLEYGLHRGSRNLVVSAFGLDLSQRALMMPLLSGATHSAAPGQRCRVRGCRVGVATSPVTGPAGIAPDGRSVGRSVYNMVGGVGAVARVTAVMSLEHGAGPVSQCPADSVESARESGPCGAGRGIRASVCWRG
ncbi:AMP-binding protein [Streptomyces albipurpureus]|uniref:AMP-binding protein n=1 Tax=Streptomyces albipurpureus TaxID=2897419 RepID=A0ABT0UZF3_9ACTN|nr:AMP-binding protein [Streptomyces sp. CWNU-1]MCM2393651.1 AMP-binding protein [Streptomyces sp. CWNU-1]